MATLAKRATIRQARVMRIVVGAVMNAAHAHPGAQLNTRLARSIAKRATGTLSAQWRDVLALPLEAASEAASGCLRGPPPHSPTPLSPRSREGRRFHVLKPAALRLQRHLGMMAGAARRDIHGSAALHADLVTALRLLADAMGRSK